MLSHGMVLGLIPAPPISFLVHKMVKNEVLFGQQLKYIQFIVKEEKRKGENIHI